MNEILKVLDEMRERKVNNGKFTSPTLEAWADRIEGALPPARDADGVVVVGAAQRALTGKYGDVLRPFVVAMEAELHANAGKGDRPGWLAMSPQTALLEIYYHLAKLQKAVRNESGPLIQEHAADVANMSMMLLDICGGLALIGDDPPAQEPTPPASVPVAELVALAEKWRGPYGREKAALMGSFAVPKLFNELAALAQKGDDHA